jgi:hypothetical protein
MEAVVDLEIIPGGATKMIYIFGVHWKYPISIQTLRLSAPATTLTAVQK